MNLKSLLSGAFAAACIVLALPAHADCIDDAGQFHGVNPWILRAIASVETGFQPNLVGHNSNGTIDISLFGINTVHLPELHQFGMSQDDLRDPCKSAYVAAWLYRREVERYGNTWVAVGSYHSKTPRYREIYITKIKTTLSKWGVEVE